MPLARKSPQTHCRGGLAAAPTTHEGHRTEGSQGRCHVPCRLRRGKIPRRAPRWAQSALLATSRGDRTLLCKQLQGRFTPGVVADMNLSLCVPPMPMEDRHHLSRAWHYCRARWKKWRPAADGCLRAVGKLKIAFERASGRAPVIKANTETAGRAPPVKLASAKPFRPKSPIARVCEHDQRL